MCWYPLHFTSFWPNLYKICTPQKPKLTKLIKLWEDKSIFSASTLSKMRSTEESWEAFKARMKEDYRAAIETALAPSQQTLDNYRCGF